MKTKSFQAYIEKRLTKEELAEIDRQAQIEVDMIRSIQRMLSETMAEFMKKNDIGFNELVRRLETSPSQVAKIQRGEANLTLSSFAHLLVLMGKEPQDVFKIKKADKYSRR